MCVCGVVCVCVCVSVSVSVCTVFLPLERRTILLSSGVESSAPLHPQVKMATRLREARLIHAGSITRGHAVPCHALLCCAVLQADLDKPIGRFFDKLSESAPTWRSNFGLTWSPSLVPTPDRYPHRASCPEAWRRRATRPASG